MHKFSGEAVGNNTDDSNKKYVEAILRQDFADMPIILNGIAAIYRERGDEKLAIALEAIAKKCGIQVLLYDDVREKYTDAFVAFMRLQDELAKIKQSNPDANQ